MESKCEKCEVYGEQCLLHDKSILAHQHVSRTDTDFNVFFRANYQLMFDYWHAHLK